MAKAAAVTEPGGAGAAPVRIRDAAEADLPTLVGYMAKLALHVSGEPPQTLKKSERERLHQALRGALSDSQKRVLVATTPRGRRIGMGTISIWRNPGIWEQAGDVEDLNGVIDDVWVEPDYRGRGVFQALLRELLAFAEQRGVDELMLEYSASNAEATAVWARLGFKPTGIRAAAFTSAVRAKLGQG